MQFVSENAVEQRLQAYIERLEAEGLLTQADECRSVWNLTEELLRQMSTLLGGARFSLSELTAVLEQGFSLAAAGVLPTTADCVLFNFGWLPGAEHDVHSTADGSVPALRAALEALRPGGVLAAVLYSGKVIGDAEKQAALAFFKALPLTQYTVLVCEFANWAQTAPLPCFVIKK